MKKLLLLIAATVFTTAFAAEVVRPAADFTFNTPAGSKSLKSVRGQPVLLFVAPSPRSGKFRKQVRYIEEIYRLFAGRDALFAAAFTREDGRIRSDIPFVRVNDPQALGAGEGYQLHVIGPDGNLDLITREIHAGRDLLSVLDNTYAVQQEQR